MHIRFSCLLVVASLAVASSLPAAAPAAPAPAKEAPAKSTESADSPSFLERLSVSPFVSYRLHEFSRANNKFGGGLSAGFQLNSRLTLELETLAERFDDSNWDGSLTEAGANLKLYPFESKVVRPYVLLGYTRNLDEDQDRMNAGLGVEWNLSKHIALGADGRWTHDWDIVGHVLFRGFLRFKL
jgi:opacity protein-like surface antigen